MKKSEDYRPAYIEFDVATDGSLMPENFGSFDSAEEAAKFMGGNMVVINQSLTVNRHMDNFEKKELRENYNHLLENVLPVNENNLSLATSRLSDAKKVHADAVAMVDATLAETKIIAAEVKRGLKEITLDDSMTYKIPYKGRFYIYTYIDKTVRLVAIRNIPEHERGELFSQSASNEVFIDTNFGGTTEK